MEGVSPASATSLPLEPARSAAARALRGVALVLAFVVGVGLRWWGLSRESFWFDEGYTAWVASLQPGEIIRVIRGDVSPPTYYLLLHYWLKLFGDSEAALRGFSAMCGTLSLGVFYLLARRMLQRPVAVLAAVALFAVSVLQLQYCQEARFYELASLLALLSLWFLTLRLQGAGGWALLAVMLCAAAGLYTHNMMAFYVLALDAAWLALPGPTPTRRRVRELLLVNLAVALLYLPWLPTALRQMQWINGNFWAHPPDVREFAATFSAVAGFKHLHAFDWPQRLILPWWSEAGMLYVSWLAVAALIVGLLARSNRRRHVALLLYALLPLVIVYFYSRWRMPLFLERVFVPSAAVMPLLLAAPLTLAGRRWTRALAGALAIVLIALGVMAAVGSRVHEHKEDWRDLCQHLTTRGGEDCLIVFVANEGELLWRYYAPRFNPQWQRQQTLGLPTGFFQRDPPQTIARVRNDEDLQGLKGAVQSGRWRRLLLVSAHPWWADPDARVTAYLDRRGTLVQDTEFYGPTVREYLIER